MNYIRSIWNSESLRKKILFTIAIVVLYKFISHIPTPGVDLQTLKLLFETAKAQTDTLGVFSILLGGNLQNFSIALMGLSPYINASIIIQLLTVIIPKLEQIAKEGSRGQKKLNMYTRWLTLPLAFLQSYGMILLLNNIAGAGVKVVDQSMLLPAMVTVTAGTILLMWLGELISEKGIGNGASILIFASIATGMPQILLQSFSLATEDSTKYIGIGVLALVTLLLTLFVVWFTEGIRNIPVTYTGQVSKGNERSALPIKVNQAGMVPIIFAVSMVTFPSIIATLVQNSQNEVLKSFSQFILNHFNPNNPTFWYVSIYFFFVIFFAFFYVSIVFKPQELSETLQKRGGFIPGVRPGNETAEYLNSVSMRLNLWGGVFIGLVAIFPYLFQFFTSSSNIGSVPLLISGASLIIIVGVVLDIFRKINVELVMHDYDKFY